MRKATAGRRKAIGAGSAPLRAKAGTIDPSGNDAVSRKNLQIDRMFQNIAT